MDYTGPGGSLTAKRGNLTQRILNMDEVRNSFAQLPRFDILEWEELLDSCDVGLPEWTRMSREISENYHKYEGFVIVHGTDTLAFTASALSFMLENLGKPVVLTGAMLPMVRVESDAKQNLLLAMSVAAYSQINEVCLLFSNKLLRGNRSTKVDNWSVTAFDSPNSRPLGRIGVEIMIDDRTTLAPPKRAFKIFTHLHTNIPVIRLCPGLDTTAVVKALVAAQDSKSNSPSKKVSGIVFELFGSGNAPVRNGEFLTAVKTAMAANVPVVILSQCMKGSCNLDAYETGHQLQSAGVINGKDMTTEASVAKLAYLLGKGYRGQELRSFMESSLRGEVTVRTNVLFNPNALQQQQMVSKSATDTSDENQAHFVPPSALSVSTSHPNISTSTSNHKPVLSMTMGGVVSVSTPTPSIIAANLLPAQSPSALAASSLPQQQQHQNQPHVNFYLSTPTPSTMVPSIPTTHNQLTPPPSNPQQQHHYQYYPVNDNTNNTPPQPSHNATNNNENNNMYTISPPNTSAALVASANQGSPIPLACILPIPSYAAGLNHSINTSATLNSPLQPSTSPQYINNNVHILPTHSTSTSISSGANNANNNNLQQQHHHQHKNVEIPIRASEIAAVTAAASPAPVVVYQTGPETLLVSPSSSTCQVCSCGHPHTSGGSNAK